MKKLITVIALASCMGIANAEPMQLSEAQMDNVSAGGFSFAGAFADALGLLAATTATSTTTQVEVLSITPIQGGQITVDMATSVSASASSAI